MDPSQFHQTLEELHAQLESTPVVDDESRQLLQHLMADIQTVLDKPTAAAHASLRTRLDTAAAHFEDSHSDLALTLKQVIDHLAQV
ncbi:MAG TPA: DUF4404 family protein [Anaerolineae bacterium]